MRPSAPGSSEKAFLRWNSAVLVASDASISVTTKGADAPREAASTHST
jgi:hypothetical protein